MHKNFIYFTLNKSRRDWARSLLVSKLCKKEHIAFRRFYDVTGLTCRWWGATNATLSELGNHPKFCRFSNTSKDPRMRSSWFRLGRSCCSSSVNFEFFYCVNKNFYVYKILVLFFLMTTACAVIFLYWTDVWFSVLIS